MTNGTRQKMMKCKALANLSFKMSVYFELNWVIIFEINVNERVSPK